MVTSRAAGDLFFLRKEFRIDKELAGLMAAIYEQGVHEPGFHGLGSGTKPVDVLVFQKALWRTMPDNIEHGASYALGGGHILGQEPLRKGIERPHHGI
jgi:hypothetical protein